jgi:hypothetical protein
MKAFCSLVEHFLIKVEELYKGLIFDLDLDIDLSKVKDDITKTQYSFSFMQHLDNRLADAYLDLSTKACTTRHNGLFKQGGWDWKAIFLYQRKVEALKEMLLGGLHTTGG